MEIQCSSLATHQAKHARELRLNAQSFEEERRVMVKEREGVEQVRWRLFLSLQGSGSSIMSLEPGFGSRRGSARIEPTNFLKPTRARFDALV